MISNMTTTQTHRPDPPSSSTKKLSKRNHGSAPSLNNLGIKSYSTTSRGTYIPLRRNNNNSKRSESRNKLEENGGTMTSNQPSRSNADWGDVTPIETGGDLKLGTTISASSGTYKYTPASRRRSGSSSDKIDDGGQEQTGRRMSTSSSRYATPTSSNDNLADQYSYAIPSTSNVDWGDEQQILGTFSVPTFKNGSRPKMVSRKSHLTSTSLSSEEEEQEDQDSPMVTQIISVPLGQPLSRPEEDSDSSSALPPRRRSSNLSTQSKDITGSSRRTMSRRRSSKSPPSKEEVGTTGNESRRRRSSTVSTQSKDHMGSRAMSGRRSSKSSSSKEEVGTTGNESRRRSYRKYSSTGRMKGPPPQDRATFTTIHRKYSEQEDLSNTNSEEPRRKTLDNLLPSLLPMEEMLSLYTSVNQANNYIPPLPLVKTCKIIKSSPSTPAGLYLTKSSNNSVTVHSLSPTSLFNSTDLQPGYEVLSVNNKRVNDPKMAATLISQAKSTVGLRVSEQRMGGFRYCQVKRRGEQGAAGAGLRFVTAGIDGVKRGYTNFTKKNKDGGLVRVSALEENGLFAKSHPLNRLRVGSVVLTVNGMPVTNGRKALELVMGSECLVEVLHVDEREWREDWLRCSLEEVEGGAGKNEEEIMNLAFRREKGKKNEITSSGWSLEWDSANDQVIARKRGAEWAFRLLFNISVGTCHSEEVEGIRMPPTDEFDVPLLVQLVNEKQRTMMRVLRSMLGRAKFELQFGSGSFLHAKTSGGGKRRDIDTSENDTHDDEYSSTAKYRRKMSYDALQVMLMKDENEDELVDEEMCNLVNDLLRVDDRDRQRKRLSHEDATSGRRGSTGHIPALTAANFDDTDLEAWYLENMGNDVSNNDKLQWIHSRRKRRDERQNSNRLDISAKSTGSAFSMFSAGMLEEIEDFILDDLGTSSDGTPSFATKEADTSQNGVPPKSPGNKSVNEKLDSTKSSNNTKGTEMSTTQREEKKSNEQSAYITGVFRDVATKYAVSDVVVGSGGFGEVRECTDKKKGLIHVVKTITKPPTDDTSKINLIRNEILLLHEAKHPNIVELKDLFEDRKCVHIVMEKCTGGDLFDRVVNENPARIRNRAEFIKHESRTANTVRSIMQVIKYLHSKDIVHRDIKPEHFLLTTDKKESQRIKLIDFGLARKHKKGSSPMTTFTGSPSFVAPEVIARSYDHMCDLFSTGVTAYFLLTGMLPFDGPSDEDTFDLISMGDFRFPSSSIHMSDDARDFITKLLRVNPNKRMTAEQALDHAWLKKDASC